MRCTLLRGWSKGLAGTLGVLWPLAAAATQAQSLPASGGQAGPPLVAGTTALTDHPCASQRGAGDDWAALCRYRQANSALADSALTSPPRAVFLGDSITEFWLTTAPALFAGGVIDRGIAGQTSQQILLRFMQDVVRLHPRIVHILCGTNDLAGNTGPTAPETYADMVVAMTDLARANGITVILGSIPPSSAFNWRPGLRPAAQIIAINQWLRDFARQRGLVFADYHAAMVGADGGMKPGLSNDGVHPNAAGYAVMEPIARAALAEAERIHAATATPTSAER